MKRLRAWWHSVFGEADRRVRFGRILGLLFIVGGFAVIGKAWDGAASINFPTGQLPYLLSGGFMGLGLIVTGVTLVLLSTVRGEREILTSKFDEMNRLLTRNLSRAQLSSNGTSRTEVVAGGTVYHRPDCKILAGKENLDTISVQEAVAEGLTPCRVCAPETIEKTDQLTSTGGTPTQ
ncbi:MAG: hypothetical protein M3290_08170 [Actinomycetota bacterium]|nr:hypothetical protein [Actinomycetota bacterium]